MPCRDEAADLLGDTVMMTYESFGKIRDLNRFRYFVFAVALRQFKKRISRRKPRAALSEAEDLPASGSSPDSRADVARLYRAIEQLPLHQSEIVVLFELSGFSLQEIAGLKHMNVNTVKTHLARGRQRLTELLNPTGQPKP